MQQSSVCIAKCRNDIDKLWRFRLDHKLDGLSKDVDGVKHSQTSVNEKVDYLENANSAILSRIEQIERVVIPELNSNIQRLVEECRRFDLAYTSKRSGTSLDVEQQVLTPDEVARGQSSTEAQLPDTQLPDTQCADSQPPEAQRPDTQLLVKRAHHDAALSVARDRNLAKQCAPSAERLLVSQPRNHDPGADPDDDDELKPTTSTHIAGTPIIRHEEAQLPLSAITPRRNEESSSDQIVALPPLEQPTQIMPTREYLERRMRKTRSRTNRVPRFQQSGMRMEQYIDNVDLLSSRLTADEQGKLIVEFIKGLDSRSLKRKIVDALATNDNTRVLRNIDGTVKRITYTWEAARRVMEAQGLVTTRP